MSLTTTPQKAISTQVINKDLAGAKNLITQFSKKIHAPSFKSSFSLIGKSHYPKMIHDLQQRIAAPWLINQHTSSLCGPASLFYCLAKDAPQVYVQCIVDLFCTGTARIRQLSIKASTSCINAAVPTGMSAVDWIALASLRDSSNSLFSYDSSSDQFSGITLPSHLQSWFRAVGYADVKRDTNLYFDSNIKNLLAARNAFNAGKNVCLFISAKALTLPFTISIIPNHWVVMSRPLRVGDPAKLNFSQTPSEIENQQFSLPVFTWGREKYELNAKSLSLINFEDYYFGYVSAA